MASLIFSTIWVAVPVAAISLIIFYYILEAFYNVTLHPLKSVPGPRWAAASRLSYTVARVRGRATHRSKNLHDKYGHVVRIAPDILSFTTSQAWVDIYGSRQSDSRGNIPRDPSFVKVLNPDSIALADDENHRRLRRVSAPGFSEKSIALQETCMQHHVALFISRLREQSSREGKVDFDYWINACTTDIIGDLAFGRSFGGLESGKTDPWLSAVFGGIKIGFQMGEIPFWILKFAFSYVPQIRRQYDEVRQYGASAAQRRMNMGTDRPDLFSSLLINREQGKISDNEITESAVAFIVGGSETTATLLSGCLYLLCRNPNHMQKLVDMIRSEFASDSDLTHRDLKGHEYLNAVLQESLRLFPPAPDSLFRRTQEPAVVAGRLIPPNTCLTMNLWAANRSARNFHRPEEFLPERWLKDCPPEFAHDDRAVAKPFSFGPHDCIGKNLAWAEMRLILAYILWHLDPKLHPESQDWIDRSDVYFLWQKPPLHMSFEPRQ